MIIDSDMTQEQVLKAIAGVIDEKAMHGGSENGRLDEAKALDKASDILEEVEEWAYLKVKADVQEAMKVQDLRIVRAEDLGDIENAAKAISDGLEYDVQSAESWLEDLEIGS